MSFEFYGGLLALDLLQKQHNAPKEQAESVAEAIIRHQDLGDSGMITTVGLLIQLATIFGMYELHKSLNHSECTDVPRQYGRPCRFDP